MATAENKDEPVIHYRLGTIDESNSDAHSILNAVLNANGMNGDDSSDDEQFIYPGASENSSATALAPSSPPPVSISLAAPAGPQNTASPAQLEALHAAAADGDLKLLQKLFRNVLDSGDIEPFALANDTSSRTGLNALLTAASRGHIETVRWLVEECGAMPDIEDKEGETPLHKAALNGHLSVVSYLVPEMADVHARDADGWTALHNASSKGYLDIVRYLCESGGAAAEIDGSRGVDVRSKGGWTPLMNAASKGHLPVLIYLLNKQSADPLVRNNWGETAYDIAAAVFEVWICEVLQKAESERWHGATSPYDPLAVHTTVPLVLYENQRLDVRLKTLAVSGGRPKFSAAGLGRNGRRAPFELRLPKPEEETRKRELPAWRSDVQLPMRQEPFNLPAPGSRDSPNASAERSHFWLSDWTLDVTPPRVDAEDGWQHAHSFNDPDDQWTAEPPPPLERLLTGAGLLPSGLASPSSRAINGGSARLTSPSPQSWVRRRRWVRVMRRRLDIPPLPFLQPDGSWYHLAEDGTLIPAVEHGDGDSGFGDNEGGQELGAMPSTPLTEAQDYLARAKYMAGNFKEDTRAIELVTSGLDARRSIAKLERATTELRQGVMSDSLPERRRQAETLLEEYSQELEQRRLAAGARGLLINRADDDYFEDDDEDDDEFRYPGASPPGTTHAGSIRSMRSDYFNRSMTSTAPNDLTPHLAQAPEFRVPTHESPQKMLSPRWSPHQVDTVWERDASVHECRDCRRRFTFINRRHCRRCGRIFCDRCSSYRAALDPSDVVHDPALPESSSSSPTHRVCRSCYEEVNANVPTRLQGGGGRSMERIVIDQERLSVSPADRRQSSSQLSDLQECPVCNRGLADLGSASVQEAHVKNCLEGGTGTPPQSAKYLVYRLPDESALIGIECVICLEEFTKGSMVARLSCLCSFHNTCLSSWLQRGRSCPVHAR